MGNLLTRKTITRIVAVCVLLAFLLCGGTGIFVYQSTIHAVNQERRSLDTKKAVLANHGFDVEAFESDYHVKEVWIDSTFGEHKIPANYLTIDGDTNRDTIIMAHGLNGNRLTGYPVAAILMKRGYNVLTYDQRDSGENQAKYMTCGYWESRDFKDCVEYVRKQTGEKKQIGAWGSSIGGATVGFYLGTKHANQYLDFAILDCPVSDMKRITEGFLIRDKIPFLPMKFKLAMGDLATRLKLGFSYEDADVRKYVKNTRVPVLVFNSKIDRVTPYYMGRDLYNAMDKNKNEILTVDDSRHTDLYWDDPKLYEKTIVEFIKGTVL